MHPRCSTGPLKYPAYYVLVTHMASSITHMASGDKKCNISIEDSSLRELRG
jgi:hypothetical protein